MWAMTLGVGDTLHTVHTSCNFQKGSPQKMSMLGACVSACVDKLIVDSATTFSSPQTNSPAPGKLGQVLG